MITRREIVSWCLYDFANSSYATIILTVAYGLFFKETICKSDSRGDFLWGLSNSISYLIAALVSPFLGAFADQAGTRKQFLIGATLLSIAATASLAFLGEGMVLGGMLLFILSLMGFALGNVFYNTFLMDLSHSDNVGKISGLGWGIGYWGGLASLILLNPWLARHEFKTAFWITAIFFLIFSLPSFIFLKENTVKQNQGVLLNLKTSLLRLRNTFSHLSEHHNLLRFLAAYFFFNDALSTVITFSSLYVRETLQMTLQEIGILFMALQITSFIGALASGFAVDRFGAKRTLIGTLWIWIFTVLGIYLVPSKLGFWVLSLIAGLGIGSCQSAARCYMTQATPKERVGEFFGFFGVFTKFSSILGPLIFGLASHWFKSQRTALLTILIFFLAGLALMRGVKDDGVKG